jgi:hypothetical protein
MQKRHEAARRSRWRTPPNRALLETAILQRQVFDPLHEVVRGERPIVEVFGPTDATGRSALASRGGG